MAPVGKWHVVFTRLQRLFQYAETTRFHTIRESRPCDHGVDSLSSTSSNNACSPSCTSTRKTQTREFGSFSLYVYRLSRRRCTCNPGPELLVLALQGLQWQTSAAMHRRETWRRAHFDALRLFGVLPHHAGCVAVASLPASATSALASSFLSELKTAQQQDPFLQSVGEQVDGSDHGA